MIDCEMSFKKVNKTNSKHIQGSILSFCKTQSANDLLKSKDGLKQGKIDPFMKSKSSPDFHLKVKRKTDRNSVDDSPAKKKRVLLHRDDSNRQMSNLPQENISQTSTCSNASTGTYNTADENISEIENENSITNAPEPNISVKETFFVSDNIPSSPVLQKRKRKHRIQDDVSPSDQFKTESQIIKAENIIPTLNQVQDKDAPVPNERKLKNYSKDKKAVNNLKDEEIIKTEKADQNKEVLEDFFFDEDDDLMNAFMDDESVALSANGGADNTSFDNKLHYIRHEVLEVCNQNDQFGYPMKSATVQNKKSKLKHTVLLKSQWADLNVESGDIVNLVPENTGALKGNCTVVDDKNNLLVLHPDTLISGTTVSNGLGCLRRAILNERFKNTEIPANADNISPVMLVGTIVHSVFQSAVKLTSTVTRESLLKLAKDAVSSRRYFSDMLTMNTDSKTVLAQVESYIPQIESWIKEYKRDRPTTGVGSIDFQLQITAVPDHLKPARGSTVRYNASVALTEVKDIEENVWSPRFGLKGKIDLTGKFQIKNNKTQAMENFILPLELKTGKDSHSMEHHVQVAIYTMFCNERRNKDGRPPDSLPAGLLLYLKNVKSSCVPLKRADQTGVLLLRNKIADYLVKTTIKKSTTSDSTFSPSSFPPTIDNTRSCQRCSQLRNCALVYKAIDETQGSYRPTSELMVLLSQIFEHLTDTDLAYFKHWATCTFLEEQETNKKEKQKRFWLKTPKERMSEGKCITNLVLASSPQAHPDLPDSLVQTFKRQDCGTENTFQIGEMVLISGTEPSYIAMATGVVHAINQSFISITTDRDFSGYDEEMSYSIDRHVWLGGISVQSALSNLSILMADNLQCNSLRQLIIMHREPTFVKNLDFVPRSAKDEVGRMLRGLNRTQRQAIKRVLLSKDYTLVVGMPGSGKTTTIVAMIRILLLCGLRVLVTSYTHSAVDNLLIKLIKYKTKFLRLGRSGQVHPSVHPYTEEGLSLNMKSPRELLKLYDESRVVACTCLAVTSHAFFAIPSQNRPIFDVCIVDEASQIAQPACLAPLLHSRRFVLVGDHLQLPPLVVSQEARKMGADESLFRRLTSHKPALCELTLQYRMNKDIMELSNHVTYEGRLECAHPSVADATVKLDDHESMKALMTDDTKWLNRAIDPKISVLFLDTSHTEAYEEEVDQGIHNTEEAKIISALTKWLIKAGCNASRIGIIAPFRKQLKAIEEKLNQIEENTTSVEINTVDKYQGRDKSVILVSFVRSKKEALGEKKGELLNDWRRLNVAITRAKHKLVMVGCTRSLMEYDPCKKIIEYVRSKDLVHFVPSCSI